MNAMAKMQQERVREIEKSAPVTLAVMLMLIIVFCVMAPSAFALDGPKQDAYNASTATGAIDNPYRILITDSNYTNQYTRPSAFWSGTGNNTASGSSSVVPFTVVFEQRAGNTKDGTLISSMTFDMHDGAGRHVGSATCGPVLLWGSNGSDITDPTLIGTAAPVWSGLGSTKQADWIYAFRLVPYTKMDTSTGDLRIGFSWKGCIGTYFDDWDYSFDAVTATKGLATDKQLKVGDTVQLTYYGAYTVSTTSRGTEYSIDFNNTNTENSIDGTSVLGNPVGYKTYGVVGSDGFVHFNGDNSIKYGGNYTVSKLSGVTISNNNTAITPLMYAYDGNAVTPVVTCSGRKLTLGTDYTINYTKDETSVTEAREAGTYVLTINGKGAYQGSVTKTLTIYPIAWDGVTADTTWYDGTKTSYTIANAAQLAGLAVLCNGTSSVGQVSFSGITIELSNDINLNNKAWTPIGYSTGMVPAASSPCFSGTFDGRGYTISGLYINTANDTSMPRQGLFSYVYNGATIKNIAVSGNVSCASQAAGIAAWVSTNVTFENCVNQCAVTTTSNAGGIAGIIINGVTIKSCSNTGAITSSGTNSLVGGIVGSSNRNTKAELLFCSNTGQITGGNAVGGIMGMCSTTAATNYTSIHECVNSGNVSTSNVTAGGIIGNLGRYDSLCACMNKGIVQSTKATSGCSVGGIVGTRASNALGLVCDNYNVGIVKAAAAAYLGAFMGNSVTAVTSVQNNYYLDTLGVAAFGSGLGTSQDVSGSGESKTDTIMKSTAFVDTINKLGKTYWYYDYNSANDGYPVLANQAAANVILDSWVTLPIILYTGSAITVSPVIASGNTVLKDGTDYSISYKDSSGAPITEIKDVGNYQIIITGVGDYRGSVIKTFSVLSNEIVDSDVSLDKTSVTFSDTSQVPTVTVKKSDYTLTEGTDYSVTYKNANGDTVQSIVDAGIYTISIDAVAAGRFTGSVEKTFTVQAKDVSSMGIGIGYSYFGYNGDPIKPVIGISNNGNLYENNWLLSMTEGTDYTLSYVSSDNSPLSSAPTEIGDYKLTITYKGNYTGAAGPFDVHIVDTNTSEWNGFYDFSWYNADSDTYHFSTPAQWAAFSYATKGYFYVGDTLVSLMDPSTQQGKTYIFDSDIDFGSIASPLSADTGKDVTIDGQNHTITSTAPLLNTTRTSTLIKNITMDGTFKSNGNCASLVVESMGNLTLDNCVNQGNVSGQNAGGLIGEIVSEDYSKNVSLPVTITNCVNKGNVTCTSSIYLFTGASAGGIFGTLSAGSVTIASCKNSGIISGIAALGQYGTGGIAGTLYPSATGSDGNTIQTSLTIEECENTGEVNATARCGGLIGNVGQNKTENIIGFTIQNSYSSGAITVIPTSQNSSGKYFGGIIGYIGNIDVISVSDSYTSGTITGGDAATTGAVIGWEQGTPTTQTLSNIWYPETLTYGAISGASVDGVTAAPVATMTAPAFADTLNGSDGAPWLYDLNNANSGYPILAWQEPTANPFDISQSVATVKDAVYTGAETEPETTLLARNGHTLVEGTDYGLYLIKSTQTGEGSARAVGNGLYTGTKDLSYQVVKGSLSTCTIAEIANQPYTGSAIKPALKVTNSAGIELVAGTDYGAVYFYNTEKGTAKVTITGLNNYEGENSATFRIVNDSTVLTDSIAAAKKAQTGIVASEDGSDVPAGTVWTTQSAIDALNAAISTAQSVADVAGDETTTADDIAAAAKAMEEATAAFTAATKTATVDLSALETSIANANAAKNEVVISDDGTDVALGTKWTTQSAVDTLDAAIAAAKAVVDDTTSTSAQVAAAKTVLDTAITAFNAQVTTGTFESGWVGLSGAGRYDTMAAIVSAGFTSADTVIIAAGTNFPDALAASGLAGANKAPILLTDGTELSAQTSKEIDALKASKAIIIGGENTVSVSVEKAISDKGLAVSRVVGSNRIETALKVYQSESNWSRTAILATGYSFADALSISPYAYATSSPIFLVSGDGSLSDDVKAALTTDDFTDVVIVGGTSRISVETEGYLDSLFGTGNVRRLSGANRYQTSVAIANFSVNTKKVLSFDKMAVATGQTFPDALAGAALCGSKGSILLLVDDSDTGRYGVTYAIASNKASMENGYFLGGESAISQSLRVEIATTSGLPLL